MQLRPGVYCRWTSGSEKRGVSDLLAEAGRGQAMDGCAGRGVHGRGDGLSSPSGPTSAFRAFVGSNGACPRPAHTPRPVPNKSKRDAAVGKGACGRPFPHTTPRPLHPTLHVSPPPTTHFPPIFIVFVLNPYATYLQSFHNQPVAQQYTGKNPKHRFFYLLC